MEYTNIGLVRLRRKSIHFLRIEDTIHIHMGLKNTKCVFESDVKPAQDCIHFFGLHEYKNRRKPVVSRSGSSSGYH